MLHRSLRTAQTWLALAAASLLLAGCGPGLFERGPSEDELRAPEVAAREALAEARQLMTDGLPAEALARLAELPTGADDPLAAELLLLRADAAFAAGLPATGVEALVERETLLEDPAARAANQRRIWNRMQEAIAAGVSLEPTPETGPVVAGWLDLGRRAAAASGNAFQLRTTLDEWLARYPWHPAAPELVTMLQDEYRALTEYPRQVALLLPLGGRQAAAAAAIRDGFVAAYLAQGGEGERPSLRIYDTTALGTTGAYEQAAGNGADFIVGPLLKEELEELGGAELPVVPTLALNWTENDTVLPSHVFQFALAPEQEAAAVARRALAEGHGRALALAHDTEQGRRIMESFIATFRAGGGEVLGWQAFDPRASDFSAEITRLLLINESRARHQQLQAALGRRLEYEPRRRQDADFIFLAARAADGVLIRPQLRFHYAGDLPVYATSSIYDPARRDLSELNGVLFADMPWRVGADDVELMAEFAAFGDGALARNGRLYAFGLDAYRLVPLLNNQSERLQDGMDGATGVLRLGEDGRIQRELAWGSFRRGDVEPAPLPEPAPGLALDAMGEPAPEAGAPPGG
ncbi:penicillin-binding protein activator [Wenzhouxiangella sp. XN24]|uniref:penicillin-binding protein activator n=1 Tax=Wenzhouxiangella sp. XN24 TaxID=2713569 RepID=UPI0013ED4A3E|nr:penicillin-binding protein activator [Wenzhouxiangella sp. XN24]NGX15212.1 ABC transporter substrate-binding protein [Wenzhouxiangella sp. XN24]